MKSGEDGYCNVESLKCLSKSGEIQFLLSYLVTEFAYFGKFPAMLN